MQALKFFAKAENAVYISILRTFIIRYLASERRLPAAYLKYINYY